MSCFGAGNNNVSPDLFQKCCNANKLCDFDGTLKHVKAEPIFVQKVFDAVLFNLQGLKTVTNQQFYPALPRGARIKRVIDIRCKRFFNPLDINDPTNLRLDVSTTISGASFVEDGCGNPIEVVGPDGTYSEKIIFADTSDCDACDSGTPIFGTQNIKITGNVLVTMDLLLADRGDHETCFTVTAKVPIATENNPLFLTNFFELCIPSVFDSAFMPRFTEFCNPGCEARLATNNIHRDITVCPDGTVKADLIVALCVSCEKKVVVPVQLCVLSTGYVQLTPQVASICSTFPQLFPDDIQRDPCKPPKPCTENVCDACDELNSDFCGGRLDDVLDERNNHNNNRGNNNHRRR